MSIWENGFLHYCRKKSMLTKSSTLTQNRIAPPTLLSSWPTCTFHITWSIILVGPNYFLLNQTMWCSQPWVGQLSTLYLKAAKSVTMCLTFVLLLSICCLTAVLLLSYKGGNKFVSAGQVGQHSIICTFAFQAWDSHSPATPPTQDASTLLFVFF